MNALSSKTIAHDSFYDIPLVHKIKNFYKKIYFLSENIPKKIKYGLYLKIEKTVLDILGMSITASLEDKKDKLIYLKKIRIKIEILKRLFRLLWEVKIIIDKKYLDIQNDLQEMSKMTNGWIKYINK